MSIPASNCQYDYCGWDDAFEKGRLAGIQEERDRVIGSNATALSRTHTDTQEAAAFGAFPRSGSLRRKVYDVIAGYGSIGVTDDYVEQRLGREHQSISARRRELVLGGFIVDSGMRRKTRSGKSATVWVAVDSSDAQTEQTSTTDDLPLQASETDAQCDTSPTPDSSTPNTIEREYRDAIGYNLLDHIGTGPDPCRKCGAAAIQVGPAYGRFRLWNCTGERIHQWTTRDPATDSEAWPR